MDAETVVATARSGNAPGTWVVWPLRRSYLRNSIIRWLAVTVVGFLLLVPASLSTVPGIFSLRGFAFVLTGIILLALAALAFGALSIVLYDGWRLLHADDYWLVVTPDEFVKSMPGGKVVHVPLEYVESITLKGVKAPVETAESPFDGTPTVMPGFLGRGVGSVRYRQQRATSPSLAFLDSRTGREVVVASDTSYDDLRGIEYVLSMQADAKQRQINRNRPS
jgi:hypothetical protein